MMTFVIQREPDHLFVFRNKDGVIKWVPFERAKQYQTERAACIAWSAVHRHFPDYKLKIFPYEEVELGS